MSMKLSVEEVLANLEVRADFLREQEAFHAREEAHHHEQRAIHAVELETVLQNLEAFRNAASSAVTLARPTPVDAVPVQLPEELPAPEVQDFEAPPPGRSQVSRMLRKVVQSPSLAEPFGASAVAAEANRCFADHLAQPITERTASDVLRRMLAEGTLQLARKGRPSYEALYIRRRRR